MHCADLVVSQVALACLSGTGLDDFRMDIVRVTVELYMMITTRNMDQFHTDASIGLMTEKLWRWTELVTELHSELKAQNKAHVSIHIPKVHELQHMIPMTRLKGLSKYHSTEG